MPERSVNIVENGIYGPQEIKSPVLDVDDDINRLVVLVDRTDWEINNPEDHHMQQVMTSPLVSWSIERQIDGGSWLKYGDSYLYGGLMIDDEGNACLMEKWADEFPTGKNRKIRASVVICRDTRISLTVDMVV